MTRSELLAALRQGERVYADDRVLCLGDPARIVPAHLVHALVNEGMLAEQVLAENYSLFTLKEKIEAIYDAHK